MLKLDIKGGKAKKRHFEDEDFCNFYRISVRGYFREKAGLTTSVAKKKYLP